MNKTIGSKFTYQATAPLDKGPLKVTINIHAIDTDNAVSYLEDEGYTNLVSVPKEKTGPKKVVTQVGITASV